MLIGLHYECLKLIRLVQHAFLRGREIGSLLRVVDGTFRVVCAIVVFAVALFDNVKKTLAIANDGLVVLLGSGDLHEYVKCPIQLLTLVTENRQLHLVDAFKEFLGLIELTCLCECNRLLPKLDKLGDAGLSFGGEDLGGKLRGA